MTPFFGDDGGEILYEALQCGIAGDERNAAGGGFLFAPGVVGEDILQRDGGEVDPARVGWELQTEDIFLAGGGFHGGEINIKNEFRNYHKMGKFVISAAKSLFYE